MEDLKAGSIGSGSVSDKVSKVNEAIIMLGHEIKDLEEVVGRLEHRIAIALVPATDQPDVPPMEPEPASELVACIKHQREWIQASTTRLNSILDRLEL